MRTLSPPAAPAAESVLWAGRPRPRPIGLAPDERAPAVLTLGWFAIASYAVLWALDRGGSAYAVLLAAAPLAFLVRNGLRLWRAHRLRAARRYVLTGEAAYWYEGEAVTRAVPLADVGEVSVHRHGRATATVVLGPTNRAAEVLRRSSTRATTGRQALAPAFESLPAADAEEAARVVRQEAGTLTGE